MKNYVLSIDCPDETGIVHKITGVLFRRGLNIVANGEFVDHKAGRFFMRTEFSGEPASLPDIEDFGGVLPAGHNLRLAERRKKNIVIMVTKEPHCLGDLLIRHAFENIEANVLAVVGSDDLLRPLTEKFEVPFHFAGHESKSRQEHEEEVLGILKQYSPEYVVMAKYMRILSEAFTARYPFRMINIHHSFLPAFAGANPYRQAYERGVKIIGATAHFVTKDLDEGPIIAQSVIPVDHTHSWKDMAQAGRDVETIVLARALKLVFEDRVFVQGQRTIIFD